MLRITIWIPDFYEFISGEYISGFVCIPLPACFSSLILMWRSRVLYKYILLMIYHYIWKVDLLNTD